MAILRLLFLEGAPWNEMSLSSKAGIASAVGQIIYNGVPADQHAEAKRLMELTRDQVQVLLIEALRND